MKTFKEFVAVGVTIAMSLGALAACGASDQSEVRRDSTGAVVIKFGINVANPQKQEPATYAIVNAFNKKNKGKYKVKFEAADTETHNKNMKLEASDGSLPEVFWVEGSQVTDFLKADVLLNLKDFLAENPSIKKGLSGAEKAFQTNDVQYGLPYQSNVQGFFYNKEIFDKAGVHYPTNSTTYDEFLRIVSKLKNYGVTPITIGSKNSSYAMWEFNLWLSRYGWQENIPSILKGKKKFNNPSFRNAFTKIEKLRQASAFPGNVSTMEYFDAKQQFEDGKAAMFGSGQWDNSEFDKKFGSHIGFWWGPTFTDSHYSQKVGMRVPSAPIAVNSSISDNAEVKKATYAFLKFYYSKKAAKISYENSVFPGTNYPGLSPRKNQYTMTEMVKALSDRSYTYPEAAPDLTVSTAVQQALYDSIFGVIQGTYTPDQALKKIDEAQKNNN